MRVPGGKVARLLYAWETLEGAVSRGARPRSCPRASSALPHRSGRRLVAEVLSVPQTPVGRAAGRGRSAAHIRRSCSSEPSSSTSSSISTRATSDARRTRRRRSTVRFTARWQSATGRSLRCVRPRTGRTGGRDCSAVASSGLITLEDWLVFLSLPVWAQI